MRILVMVGMVAGALLFLAPGAQAQESPQVVEFEAACGNIIENTFTTLFAVHEYAIELQPGDAISVQIEHFKVDAVSGALLLNPRGVAIADSDGDTDEYLYILDFEPELETDDIGIGGTHRLVVTNRALVYSDIGNVPYLRYGAGQRYEGGTDDYVLYIGCTLSDGTEVVPGSSVVIASSPDPADDAAAPSAAPTFGLAGIAPVDFAAGIPLPLTPGTPTTTALRNDIVVYTYTATAGESATLSVSRSSGDVSIGVAVVHQPSNALVFLGGMPTSDQLSVVLTFPQDGTYAIGLFRLDTPELQETAGAVEIMVQ